MLVLPCLKWHYVIFRKDRKVSETDINGHCGTYYSIVIFNFEHCFSAIHLKTFNKFLFIEIKRIFVDSLKVLRTLYKGVNRLPPQHMYY